MGIVFWAGLFWRRATAAGAWAGTLLAFGALLFTSEIALPYQMLIYLTAGVVGVVVISLFTQPPDREKLDRFYEVLRTPVEAGEVVTEPLQLPQGRTPGPQRKLINHPDWEIQRPTARGLNGFFIAWGLVALLIAGVWMLVRIGT